MWRRVTQWMKRFWPLSGGDRFGDRSRTKLIGLYLDCTNASGSMREPTDPCQERSDGKFAQRRNRD
jgi:hypothetical protein